MMPGRTRISFSSLCGGSNAAAAASAERKSGTTPSWAEGRMLDALQQRRERGMLRRLHAAPNVDDEGEAGGHSDSNLSVAVVDFSSNDYLGLAHDEEQSEMVRRRSHLVLPAGSSTGATGSRLLSGDSKEFHELESYLADVHRRQAALVCNSGYDANLTVVSSLPCTCIVYDEYAHNSLHMGMRLWISQQSSGAEQQQQEALTRKECFSFRHNSVDDLRSQLQLLSRRCSGTERSNPPATAAAAAATRIVVLVESVYSMDGDVAPIGEMLDVCSEFDAQLVVDEAHGLGCFGRAPPVAQHGGAADDVAPPSGTGVLARDEVEDHPALLCSIHTFGKAAGCHGAVVCGSSTLKQYLINYGYPLIYSTALPYHSLVTIRCSYETMTGPKGDRLREHAFRLVEAFRSSLNPILDSKTSAVNDGRRNGSDRRVRLLPATSPIQALMLPGNEPCTQFCKILYDKSGNRILLYPIKSPTVPAGQERIRIILHSHNTFEEVELLVALIRATLGEMGLIQASSRL